LPKKGEKSGAQASPWYYPQPIEVSYLPWEVELAQRARKGSDYGKRAAVCTQEEGATVNRKVQSNVQRGEPRVKDCITQPGIVKEIFAKKMFKPKMS